MEKKFEIRIFLIEMLCDDCEGGVMKPTGVALTSNPPKYPHKCNTCGVEHIYLRCYPYKDYELKR
jgi:hypothetical protein